MSTPPKHFLVLLLFVVFLLAAGPADATYSGWYEAGDLTEGYLTGAWNGHLYSRNWDGSNYHFSYASIRSDGSVGSWQATGAPATNGYYTMGNGYVYIRQKSVSNRTCAYAPIHPDGTLGVWTDTSSAITVRQSPALTVTDQAVYAVGGNVYNNGSFLNTCEYALIQPDGSLGPWQAGPNMAVTHPQSAAVAHDGYLYCFSGGRHGYLTNRVERAPIQPDGSLGSWQTISEMALPQARYSFQVSVIDGVFYVFGGGTKTYGGNYLTNVLYGSFDELGTFTGWQNAPDLPNIYARFPAYSDGRFYINSTYVGPTVWASEPLGEAVPEPVTCLTLGLGVAGLARAFRRRTKTPTSAC